MTDYISAYKSQMVFMGLDIEADKPIKNAELIIVIAELKLESNWTKFETIPRNIFIPRKWGKTSPLNKT